jgi:hypothetical protein
MPPAFNVSSARTNEASTSLLNATDIIEVV